MINDKDDYKTINTEVVNIELERNGDVQLNNEHETPVTIEPKNNYAKAKFQRLNHWSEICKKRVSAAKEKEAVVDFKCQDCGNENAYLFGCLDCISWPTKDSKTRLRTDEKASIIIKQTYKHNHEADEQQIKRHILCTRAKRKVDDDISQRLLKSYAQIYRIWMRKIGGLPIVRMKPEEVCRIFGACAVLHTIAISRNEPLVNDDSAGVRLDQPVQVPAFLGVQDGRNTREHVARSFLTTEIHIINTLICFLTFS
ncbi:HARBI1 [Mytilus edulis]|uniref:HARBI1 n=1 Tax=Mytilus edulis TaxID=6550 RepID=A0A8S3SF04_MYTED|nr:HARBI1 [Mytilus edulis]